MAEPPPLPLPHGWDEAEPGAPGTPKHIWDAIGYSEEEHRRNHPDNALPAREHGGNDRALPAAE